MSTCEHHWKTRFLIYLFFISGGWGYEWQREWSYRKYHTLISLSSFHCSTIYICCFMVFCFVFFCIWKREMRRMLRRLNADFSNYNERFYYEKKENSAIFRIRENECGLPIFGSYKFSSKSFKKKLFFVIWA